MQFLLYFYDDKTVTAIDGRDVILGEYSEYQVEDWSNETAECKVQAMYDDQVYEACVLQVAPDSLDLTELTGKLSSLIVRKKTSVQHLLGLVKRVAPTKRQIVPPIDTFFTESEPCRRSRRVLDKASSDSSEEIISNKKRKDESNEGRKKESKKRAGGTGETQRRVLVEDSSSSTSESTTALTTRPVQIKRRKITTSDASTQTDGHHADRISALEERMKLMERRILTEIVKLRGSRSTNSTISDIPLPLASPDDLRSLDQKMSDEAVFDALVTQLKDSEGLTGMAFSRNILKRLFSSSMIKSVSWSGRGQTSQQQLKGTRIIEAIWRTVNAKYPAFPWKEFKKAVSDFLKFAKRSRTV